MGNKIIIKGFGKYDRIEISNVTEKSIDMEAYVGTDGDSVSFSIPTANFIQATADILRVLTK